MNEEVNFCSQCGAKVSSGAKFCSNCGYVLQSSSTQTPLDKTIKVEVTNATVEKGFKAVGEGFEAVGKAFKRKEKNAPKTEEQIQKEAELYDYSDHRLEHQEKFSLSLPEESDPSTTGDSFIPIAILIGVVIFIFYIYISYGF